MFPTARPNGTSGRLKLRARAFRRDGSTIIMVTHDRRFARCAQRTIGLLDGQLTSELERVEAQL